GLQEAQTSAWRLSNAKVGEGIDVVSRSLQRKTAKNRADNAARAGGQFRRNGTDCDAGRAIRRKSINASGDRRECQRAEMIRSRELKRGPITGGKEFIFTVLASAPHRSHRVNHMSRFQPIAAGDLGAAGFATAECPAFGEQ